MKNTYKKLLAQIVSATILMSQASCNQEKDYTFETIKGKRNLKDYHEYLDEQDIDYKNCDVETRNNIIILKEKKYIKYKVKENETIKEIIEKYEMNQEEFLKVNGLKENDSLNKGKNIKIIFKTEHLFTIDELDEQSKWQYHLVLPGESLSEIAELYDTTPEEIQKENNIIDINKIYQYETLKIKKEEEKTKKR